MYKRKRIALITTGGTIEKTYDERSGLLNNTSSTLDAILSRLNILGVTLEHTSLMNKDSMNLDDGDQGLILNTVQWASNSYDGIVVVHGTDRLTKTAELLHLSLPDPACPVVFTGAIRPWIMRNTDALQNITESLLAVQLVSPGIYVSMHNRVIKFPGVVKDYSRSTFVRSEELESGN